MKFMFQSLFKNIRETLNVPVREVKRSHLGFTLSFDLIGQHQNKRFYITEIIWRLRLEDFSGGERRRLQISLHLHAN